MGKESVFWSDNRFHINYPLPPKKWRKSMKTDIFMFFYFLQMFETLYDTKVYMTFSILTIGLWSPSSFTKSYLEVRGQRSMSHLTSRGCPRLKVVSTDPWHVEWAVDSDLYDLFDASLQPLGFLVDAKRVWFFIVNCMCAYSSIFIYMTI